MINHKVKPWWLWILVGLALACQVSPTPPPLKSTSVDWVAIKATSDSATKQAATGILATPTPSTVVELTSIPGDLAPFPSPNDNLFAPAEPTIWEPTTSGAGVALPIQLEQLANREVLAGLSLSQRDFLSRNGFVIVHTREAQFLDIRQRVSLFYGQPYYLTTDAAYHALYLSYAKLLAAVEREELRPRMLAIIQAVFDELQRYMKLAHNSDLEQDTRLAAAYIGVALQLLDSQSNIPPEIGPLVDAQIDQIMKGETNAESVLIAGLQDDYSAYRPVGHYTSDAELQSYYRAMTWLSRVRFPIENTRTSIQPSRVPLMVTMALRRANLPQGPAVQEWVLLEEVLNFLVGVSDDNGPREYAMLMDRVYGPGVTILGLKDEGYWQVFQALAAELPPPQINSPFFVFLGALPNQPGWCFIGQRFMLDAFVLHNLVYDRVGDPGNQRLLPSGLDVMAAFGSSTAEKILQESGAFEFPGYTAQMSELQAAVQAHSLEQWLRTANSIWLFTFLSQLESKGQAYPPYMQSAAWAYKEMNSALGSWAELKQTIVINGNTPEISQDKKPPSSGPAPGFVEPAPDVFYRLAYLSSVLAEGLEQRGLRGGTSQEPLNLAVMLEGMRGLATQFQKLGNLADKELVGLPLNQDDYTLIQAALGPIEAQVECSRLQRASGAGQALEMPSMPVLSSVHTAGEQILQAGVGLVDRIYVMISIDGIPHVAQGGVYSYYEFSRPNADPLSNQVWRQVILGTPEFLLPAWSNRYILMNGVPVDVLVFRTGDIYRITPAGARLNMRTLPSLAADVIHQLQAGDYVKMTDGPVEAQDFTWWKIQVDLETETPLEGWVVVNPEWFERAWGQ